MSHSPRDPSLMAAAAAFEVLFSLDEPEPGEQVPVAGVMARGTIQPELEKSNLSAQIERHSDNVVSPGIPSHETFGIFNYRFLFLLDNTWVNEQATITVRHASSPTPPDQEVTITIVP